MLHFDLGQLDQLIQKTGMTVSLSFLWNNQDLWLKLIIFI